MHGALDRCVDHASKTVVISSLWSPWPPVCKVREIRDELARGYLGGNDYAEEAEDSAFMNAPGGEPHDVMALLAKLERVEGKLRKRQPQPHLEPQSQPQPDSGPADWDEQYEDIWLEDHEAQTVDGHAADRAASPEGELSLVLVSTIGGWVIWPMDLTVHLLRY